ncbi:DUF3846 domain-containing protein [Enterorhabdus mucosicola]|uniref:DUF3846 domain-containing protein n=1 Tax=Adlercreutzia mucosicola TaxID=580026 RepID=A0A6N8JLX7_9ACTN|nr:DUF3846 domain-containing protein [Adlercreutzia mucosicola]MVX60868.1 DUF3846 domain-containing protein [Adlercreutzia mucosicola]
MKTTLEAVIVPVGGAPYPKTLEADENGSFLRALQECVGGRIEPMGCLFDDAPTVYCNEEGKLAGSGCRPNRAIYATEAMASVGYTSPNDPSRAVRPDELYDIVFGDMVCVGFDPETGEDRDITPEERGRVTERFGSRESIESGEMEVLRIHLLARHR